VEYGDYVTHGEEEEMGRKLSAIGNINPLARPLQTEVAAAVRAPIAAATPKRRYVTKTLGGWRPEDQVALDKLRAVLAAAGKGMWGEREAVAAAIRVALHNRAAMEKA